MIHDDMQADLIKFCEKFTNPQNINQIRGMPTWDRKMLKVLCNVYAPAIRDNPQVFYFDSLTITPELIETSEDFLKNGFLKLPFKCCHFFMNNVVVVHPKEKTAKVVGGLRSFVTVIQDGDTITTATYAFSEDNPTSEPMPFAFHTFTPDNLDGEIITVFDTHNLEQEIVDEARITSVQNSIMSCALILLMGMPHTDKIKSEPHSEKLQKAREKRGKPRLSTHITIRLNKQISADMERQSAAKGYTVKPHWRRGHIRTIGEGENQRKIPVQACMVNWDGESTLEHKPYKISG